MTECYIYRHQVFTEKSQGRALFEISYQYSTEIEGKNYLLDEALNLFSANGWDLINFIDVQRFDGNVIKMLGVFRKLTNLQSS